jgi:SAM-dependent methyltransferase
MLASPQIRFATPRENVNLRECAFYHVMDLPGIGLVGSEWDLRPNVDSYLGDTDFAGKRVLEIGPASGFLTFTMEKKGASVVCLELTEDKAWEFVPYPESYMRSIRAQRRAGIPYLTNSFWLAHKLYASSAKVYYGDAYQIPAALGKFDIAVMAAVLLHCQNPTRIIEQCAKRANTIIIVERLFPELEGKPTCRLTPNAENKAWDTWWDFSTDFFVEYLRILGFIDIRKNTHVQLFKGTIPLPLFTIVAAKPPSQIGNDDSADGEYDMSADAGMKTELKDSARREEIELKKSARRQEAQRFVHALYRGMLHREPDPGAMYHINAILDGRPPASVAEDFLNCEESKNLAKLTSVKLFVPPGHFYSPIVDPVEAERYLTSKHTEPTPAELPGISLDRAEMIRTWTALLPSLTTVPFSDSKSAGFRYYFDNPSYSWGDGSVLHAMIRVYRPKRIIEIGSGWSSACTLDTVERYLEGACDLTFIDPYPQLLRDIIGDAARNVRVLELPIQQVPEPVFDALESGDMLFVDSTHVLRSGGDVCFELFEILPRLAGGVLVHFHDIFWPFEYPRQWVVEENRSWNELYAIRAFLTNNEAWRIVLFNDYLKKLERGMIEATYPHFLRNTGGALWLQRR